MPLPTFIGLGAQKSGSSWLAKQLAAHPDVHIPAISEVHFFDRHFGKGTSWYENCFKKAAPGQITGDITPAYFFTPEAPHRILQKLGKDIRFIVILRNPAERLHSQYKMACASQGKLLDFETVSNPAEINFQIGLYAKHLKTYFSLFPRDNFLIMIYEEMFRDEESQSDALNSVARHLGIRPDAFIKAAASAAVNKTTGIPKMAGLYRLGAQTLDFMRHHHMGWAVNLIKESGIKKDMFGGIEEIPSITEKDRAKLLGLYQEDIAELETLLGRSLSLWTTSQAEVPAASSQASA